MKTFDYKPPYSLTSKILNLSMQIADKCRCLNNYRFSNNFIILRKLSRIKSIYSSLAIEANTLKLNEINLLVQGKNIDAPFKEKMEAINAIAAYNELDSVDPFKLKELLRIHGFMTKNLIDESGKFRTRGVGVFRSDGSIVHLAPSFKMVPTLVENLFEWVNKSDESLLIKSCVFHYELEFIHPFNDGNGRMGRYWQTALLSSEHPVFKYVPIENSILEHQSEYYKVIETCDKKGDSTEFIEFMLEIINESLDKLLIDVDKHMNAFGEKAVKLSESMDDEPKTAKFLMEKLKLKSLKGFRQNYLHPALELGLIKMTIPDKPTSKNQKYYKI